MVTTGTSSQAFVIILLKHFHVSFQIVKVLENTLACLVTSLVKVLQSALACLVTFFVKVLQSALACLGTTLVKVLQNVLACFGTSLIKVLQSALACLVSSLVKVLQKQHMKRERKVEYVKREKEVLLLLGQHEHPFFVKLFATFQDPNRLCILTSSICALNAISFCFFVLFWQKTCC